MRARALVTACLATGAIAAAVPGCGLLDPARDVDAALDALLGDAPVAAKLDAVLCGLPAPPPCAARVVDAWTDTRAFYAQRAGQPAWVDHHGLTPAGSSALAALARAPEHGLVPADYGADALNLARTAFAASAAPEERLPARDLAAFEAQLTTALLALGREVAFGRSLPDATPPQWPPRRAAFDLASRLARLVETGAIAAWPDAVRPVHPEYAALQTALGAMLAGDPAAGSAGSQRLDRMRRLAINLNRWRWMPDDLGDSHVLINIPQYHLFIRERGRVVIDSRVIVGRPGDRTPVFSATMTTVVFSPYWTIPDSIAANETAPAVLRDGAYLARNNIEVLRHVGGRVERVDPRSVDWRDRAAVRDLVLRQRPGAGNALGHVKFVFPNPYTVFLHDTPGHGLFDRPDRAFSHGCIRLQQPMSVTKYVLAGDPEWDEASIKAAMLAGVEREVTLRRQLPVHVVYFTAWVDGAGALQMFDDVYGYDK